jgi:hypothetical protein
LASSQHLRLNWSYTDEFGRDKMKPVKLNLIPNVCLAEFTTNASHICRIIIFFPNFHDGTLKNISQADLSSFYEDFVLKAIQDCNSSEVEQYFPSSYKAARFVNTNCRGQFDFRPIAVGKISNQFLSNLSKRLEKDINFKDHFFLIYNFNTKNDSSSRTFDEYF